MLFIYSIYVCFGFAFLSYAAVVKRRNSHIRPSCTPRVINAVSGKAVTIAF